MQSLSGVYGSSGVWVVGRMGRRAHRSLCSGTVVRDRYIFVRRARKIESCVLRRFTMSAVRPRCRCRSWVRVLPRPIPEWCSWWETRPTRSRSRSSDFLDFSTVERRGACLQPEVALNRRLAPEAIWVSLISLFRCGAAEPVIVMRRYPDEWRLATKVLRGEPVEQELSAIADLLVRFTRLRCAAGKWMRKPGWTLSPVDGRRTSPN